MILKSNDGNSALKLIARRGKMTKKPSTNVNNEVFRVLEDTQRTLETIRELPALTGGFNALMSKIDDLQESQNKLIDEVTAIRLAIYDPDEGIYARIKNSANQERVEEVEKAVTSLSVWKDGTEKNVEAALNTEKIVATQQNDINSLKKFKETTYDVLKKIGIGAIGAGLTLVCKIVYVILTEHIHIF